MTSILYNWISDQLHPILGYSNDVIIDFIINLAINTKNSTDLYNALIKQCDLPPNSIVENFANQLYQKVISQPPNTQSNKPSLTTSKQQYQEAVDAQETNASY